MNKLNTQELDNKGQLLTMKHDLIKLLDNAIDRDDNCGLVIMKIKLLLMGYDDGPTIKNIFDIGPKTIFG